MSHSLKRGMSGTGVPHDCGAGRGRLWFEHFLRSLALVGALVASNSARAREAKPAGHAGRPNVVFVLADQWRFEAFGYAGNPDVKTPNLDRLEREGIRFVNAVSGMPVCSPMRASLLTGQRPLTHGIFVNDVPLEAQATTIGKIFRQAGYDTAYIGKWHVNGHGRSAFIPADRRQGFDYWKALECTHDYTRSAYYGDAPEKRFWEGYDAIAQTRDAQNYLRTHAKADKSFLLVLAWGPPHDPYFTAPEKYRALYDPEKLRLRPNVPASAGAATRKLLAGYYAHCTALDDCVGELCGTLEETGLKDDTLLVFTSDHGDMLGSQGLNKKQKPYDESIRVPLLFRWPKGLGTEARQLEGPINSEDLLPTLLGFCGLAIPKSVEGLDYSGYARGGKEPGDGCAVIMCVTPFGEWERRHGGKEYRGVRTQRYTYVRDLAGPWLLFDNQADPFQTNNVVNRPEYANVQARLESALKGKLRERRDEFLPGEAYLKQWGYKVNVNGTVPYTP